MKTFFKDYADLWKHNNEFMKKHWKGYIALCVAAGLVTYVPAYIAEKKNQKEMNAEMDKFLKELEELA